ncbi:MAG: peptidoglycan-binding protein, partial [Myxococcaceae bacterium]|nr:peptidoglycan-binding protein [Myxococcaceae bacterium]
MNPVLSAFRALTTLVSPGSQVASAALGSAAPRTANAVPAASPAGADIFEPKPPPTTSAFTPPPPAPIGRDFGDQLRSGDVSKTPIYLAIGLAEGTIGADGKPTEAWYQHGDPGNGRLNKGFGSYQVYQDPRGASLTPEQADRVQADRLALQWPGIEIALNKAGIAPGQTRNLIAANALDAWNQAPAVFGGSYGLLNQRRLAELKTAIEGGKSPLDAVTQWRANSYREDSGALNAPGLGNDFGRVSADQRRRVEAVARGLSLRSTTASSGAPPVRPPPPPSGATPVESTRASSLVLRSGSSGDDVRALQDALNQAGASPRLDEDGLFGPATEAAVSAYQRLRGLTVDGIAGPETLGALAESVTPQAMVTPSTGTGPVSAPGDGFDVSAGSSGTNVRLLKEVLRDAGFYAGAINGEMGPMGVEALRRAKAALKLAGPSYVADSATLDALRRAGTTAGAVTGAAGSGQRVGASPGSVRHPW